MTGHGETYGGDTGLDGRSILILPGSAGTGGWCFRLPDSGTDVLAAEWVACDSLPATWAALFRLRWGPFRRRHALEHRVLRVLHEGWPATPESIRDASPYTLRCGTVLATPVLSGLLLMVLGILLSHALAGLAAMAAGMVVAAVARRHQAGWSPGSVSAALAARAINGPFVAPGIGEDDCVLGAEMVRRVREGQADRGPTR